MKFTVAGAIVLSVWMVGVMQPARAEQAAGSAKSTWNGVFSDAQAKTGLAAYTKACSECHGEDLGGDGFAPALKGPEFMNNWNGLTVGELYDRIRVSMPPSDPNSVPAQEKVDIVAFILKQNGFPAGATALAPQADELKTIKFEATKPKQ
jgi:hypothetical protein